jgi:hypothetical protein
MSREPHGFVVVPLGRDGKPTGVALWEQSAEGAMRVYVETRRALFPIQLYRPIQVEDKGGEKGEGKGEVDERGRHASSR